MNETIVDRIKRAMQITNIRQRDLASMTGLDRRYISRLLKGEWSNPEKNIVVIAKALGVTPSWLRTGKNGGEENRNAQISNGNLTIDLTDSESEKIVSIIASVFCDSFNIKDYKLEDLKKIVLRTNGNKNSKLSVIFDSKLFVGMFSN